MRYLGYLLLLLPLNLFGQSLKEIRLHSSHLSEHRKIWISVPPHYEIRKDSLHLVILLDGNNRSLLDLTISSKRFLETNAVDLNDFNTPASLIVGIEQKDRSKDFIDSAQSFLAFLTTEVIPYLRKHYRMTPFTILIGHSLAGRFAIQALLEKPDSFGAIITASPAFAENSGIHMLPQLDSVFSNPSLKQHAWFLGTSCLIVEQPPKLYFDADTALTLSHGKTPLLTITEGFHFIYKAEQWYPSSNLRNAIFSGQVSVATALKDHMEHVRKKWGAVYQDPRWTLLAAYQCKENKELALEILMEGVSQSPHYLDQYPLLLQLLKESGDKRLTLYEKRYKKMLQASH
jgi:hypothetical protein